jgi:hypothetical protein
MPKGNARKLELYNLAEDTAESSNLFGEKPEVSRPLRRKLIEARSSIDASVAGKDYPGNKVNSQPPRIFWTEVDAYKPYFKDWKNRPEYESRLKRFKIF